jgi:TonB family protein
MKRRPGWNPRQSFWFVSVLGVVVWAGFGRLVAHAQDKNEEEPSRAVPLIKSDPLPKPHVSSLIEPPIKVEGKLGEFVRAVHARAHKRWAGGFIRMVEERLPKNNPLNDMKRRMVLQIAATREGNIASLRAISRSGVRDMDDAIMEIVRESVPWPAPPDEALSDDGRVYVTWAFHRDARLCSEIQVVQRESPLHEAIPRLMAQGRTAEAWRRVQGAATTSAEPGLSMYARLFLAQAMSNPRVAPAAAVALYGTGDTSGLELIQNTVRSGTLEMASLAAAALIRSKQPICPFIQDNLTKGTGPVLDTAMAIVAQRFEAACVPAVIAVFNNQKNPVPVRLQALKMLGESSEPSARAALDAAANDPAPAIKAVGLLASVKPASGKAAVFKLVPFLRDDSVDIRAAAAAGVVRANGDGSLDALYLLFKETDPKPYEWVAAELGKYSTDATGQLLLKILKKDEPRAHRAAAQALAARTDALAKNAVAGFASDPDAEVKALAAPAKPPTLDELGRQALSAPLPAGRKAYKTLAGNMAGRPAAQAWLLAKFLELDPITQAEVLGEWLVPPRSSS